MKRLLRLAALAALVALATMLAAIPAWAYTAVNGDSSLSFNQYLIVKDDARVPAITFSYSITPGAAIAASNGTPAIIAGVGTPTVGTAAFSSGGTTYSGVQTNDTLTLDSGEVYAKVAVTVDFSSVAFSQPGIYRYVLTEVEDPTNHVGVSYDTQVDQSGTRKSRYIDVYVEDNNGNLTVSKYVLHKTLAVGNVSNTNDPVADKSTGFVNEIKSHSLTFGKEVTGNQGSKDKYFKFTITITAQKDTTYEVDVTGADASPTATDATNPLYTTMANPTTITTASHGVVTEYYYLKDGQYITIKGLPEGYKYELSEDGEDYTSSTGIAAAEGKGGKAYSDPVTNNAGVTTDVNTGFTNTRTGIIPTGVIIAVAPFAVGLVGFGAAAAVLASRKNQDEEE